MNFVLKPSLEHIVLVKIAITLWSQNDIRKLILEFSSLLNAKEISKEWSKIEERVKETALQLSLPFKLKKIVQHYIKPIGVQIIKWIYHRNFLGLNIDLRHEICWTQQGTIDTKRMAELIIKDDTVNVVTRYKMACVFCLEKDIPALWNRIPEDHREILCCENDQQELVVFWTYVMKGRMDKVCDIIVKKSRRVISFCQYAFERAVYGGNIVAVEYFLQKMNPQEKRESIALSANRVATTHALHYLPVFMREHYSDILCMLLSKMDDKEQEEFLKECHSEVLACLLDWPWHLLFAKVVSGEPQFHFIRMNVFSKIVHKVCDGHKYFGYERLFGEIWPTQPVSYKENFLYVYSGTHLVKMFKNRAETSIRLVLGDTITQDKRIIALHHGRDICEDLVGGEDWGLLEYFVRECVMSAEYITLGFKEEARARIVSTEDKRMKDNWWRYLDMLEELEDEFYQKKRGKYNDYKGEEGVAK